MTPGQAAYEKAIELTVAAYETIRTDEYLWNNQTEKIHDYWESVAQAAIKSQPCHDAYELGRHDEKLAPKPIRWFNECPIAEGVVGIMLTVETADGEELLEHLLPYHNNYGFNLQPMFATDEGGK